MMIKWQVLGLRQGRFLVFLGLATLFIQCKMEQKSAETPAAVQVVRQAAEYDPQAAVWLIWPQVDHLASYSNEQVTLEIIDALLPHTNVKVAVANSSLLEKAKQMIPASAQEGGRLAIYEIPSEEFWARDMGPVFVENNKGERMIADFNFNSWGYSDTLDAYSKTEELFDERVADLMDIPTISSRMISEGGDREVNGEGTLLVVETVEQGRNPDMTKKEMEAEFKRLLGATNVIWLKQGLYEDDHTFLGPKTLENGDKAYTVITTNGHIDEFARFVNDSTILLGEVAETDRADPIAAENHRRMEENFAILSQARDQDGKPFQIIRVPLPSTIVGTMKPGDTVYDFISTLEYEDGSSFPIGEPVKVLAAASYLNFLITNGLIIAQKYWRPGWDESIKARDEKVKGILEAVFPSRKVVMLDALAVNFGGGGIHCISMQEPSVGKE